MTEQILNKSQEITLKTLIQIIQEWLLYLKSKLLLIFFVSLIGGLVGAIYAWLKPITYTSRVTFIVDDTKNNNSNIGGLATIAGQFGVEVGGASNGGMLAGENILFYFKSKSLIRNVLLSKFDDSGKKSIADVYVETYDLQKTWSSLSQNGKLSFPVFNGKDNYTRLQDSLLELITDKILLDQLSVSKTDKKASFIDVSTTMLTEDLTKVFCDKIISSATENYLNIKSIKQQKIIDKLQKRLDSITVLLGKKTVSGASIQTTNSTMDINPLYKTENSIAFETTTRDKTILATLFSSVTQSLEMAKFSLSQEAPIIQIIDSSRLPLVKNKLSKTKYGAAAALIVGFLTVTSLILKLEYKRIK